jgi:1,4-dihydroxy-2-naphthoyl-CoA synthase
MGLVNAVVTRGSLDAEVARWCEEILAKSPTALRIAKASFQAETDHIGGQSVLSHTALELYYGSDEAREGARAFTEKREPDFGRFRR